MRTCRTYLLLHIIFVSTMGLEDAPHAHMEEGQHGQRIVSLVHLDYVLPPQFLAVRHNILDKVQGRAPCRHTDLIKINLGQPIANPCGMIWTQTNSLYVWGHTG